MTPKRRVLLVVGLVAWTIGVALVPGELAAAKRRAPIGPRTGAALVAFLTATTLVLAGLARDREA
jgi:hypothetical protein